MRAERVGGSADYDTAAGVSALTLSSGGDEARGGGGRVEEQLPPQSDTGGACLAPDEPLGASALALDGSGSTLNAFPADDQHEGGGGGGGGGGAPAERAIRVTRRVGVVRALWTDSVE